ncbi:hypothetical protein KA183_16865 [bacterium]|nr:hypothetical protein [bacterium]
MTTKDETIDFLKDKVPLMEAFWVALAVHVAFLPLLWISGWALPWPKSPKVTMIIEYDLTNWPKIKPKSVEEVVESQR